MARYMKKPVEIEAHPWFKNGDHPKDECREIYQEDGKPAMSEGKVVRYFRRPDIKGQETCKQCLRLMHDHGWMDTLEGGLIVCPGDWIITEIAGERYPCKPVIFWETYDMIGCKDGEEE